MVWARLEDVADKRLKITLALDSSRFIPPILAYYGLDALESWGGIIKRGFGGENTTNRSEFDVLITAHGGLAGNIETTCSTRSRRNSIWSSGFAPELMTQLSERYLLEIVPVPIGLLKGIDPPMTTVARNGQSVYGRQDVPDELA